MATSFNACIFYELLRLDNRRFDGVFYLKRTIFKP